MKMQSEFKSFGLGRYKSFNGAVYTGWDCVNLMGKHVYCIRIYIKY